MAKRENELLTSSDDTYATVTEAIAVIEFFTRWVRRQAPEDSQNEEPELWPRHCEVQFVPPEKAPHVFRTHQPAGSSVLFVLVADHGFSDDERERLRILYAERFTPTLRDCQLRACANLWRQISDKEREAILHGIRGSGAATQATVDAVLADMARANQRNEQG